MAFLGHNHDDPRAVDLEVVLNEKLVKVLDSSMNPSRFLFLWFLSSPKERDQACVHGAVFLLVEPRAELEIRGSILVIKDVRGLAFFIEGIDFVNDVRLVFVEVADLAFTDTRVRWVS